MQHANIKNTKCSHRIIIIVTTNVLPVLWEKSVKQYKRS